MNRPPPPRVVEANDFIVFFVAQNFLYFGISGKSREKIPPFSHSPPHARFRVFHFGFIRFEYYVVNICLRFERSYSTPFAHATAAGKGRCWFAVQRQKVNYRHLLADVMCTNGVYCIVYMRLGTCRPRPPPCLFVHSD